MEIKKNLNQLYCLKPFTDIFITNRNMCCCCCESWLPSNAGDIENLSLQEIWNSEVMQKIRLSILDGTYSYCNKEICPYINSENYKLYSKEELQAAINTFDNNLELDSSLLMLKNLGPWIKNTIEGNVVLDILPANYNLSYDETCNLKCPGCRPSNHVYTNGEEFEKRNRIHQKLFEEIEKNGYENVRNFIVTGSGDPFTSLIYRNFLYNFDGSNYPLLEFCIMTNAQLLTSEAWEKMHKIHSNIGNILISVDAATAETYEKIRVNGNFNILLKNLEFLCKKRLENKLKYLSFVFVVQKKNYKEMIDFVKMSKKYNVDCIIFCGLDDWESMKHEDYVENAICNPDHKEYSEFLEILKDPIFSDPIVNLGNISPHRIKALNL